MDDRVYKLMKALGVDLDTAAALIAAGFVTENQAKQASKAELTGITGIGEAAAKRIRGE